MYLKATLNSTRVTTVLRNPYINDTNSDKFMNLAKGMQKNANYVTINVHVNNVKCFGSLGKEVKKHATSDSLLGL